MRILKLVGILLACLMAFSVPFMTGCEDDGGSDEAIPNIVSRGPVGIQYINYDRTQFVLTDGWTMNIDGSTEVARQRPSCSGYSYDNVWNIEMSDKIWYKYDMRAATTIVVEKEAVAIEFTAQRAECTEEPIQYVYDIDYDKDGVGATQDADDKDPNVQ